MFFYCKKLTKIFLLFLFITSSLFAEIVNIDKKHSDFDWSEVKKEESFIGDGFFKTVYKGFFEGEERAFVFFDKVDFSNVYFSKNLSFHFVYQHKNIIDLFAFSSKQKCIVYELGKDLREYILENKLELSEKLKIIKDICFGVEYLHENKVIHRDLKIENIILIFDDNQDITAKIIDFDFYLENIPLEGQKNKSICGSFFNLHPLIFQDLTYSFSREMYSLGILIYILLLKEDFYCLYSDFLKKPVVDQTSDVAIPKIKPLELINCYMNVDFQKYVDNYVKKIEDPFLEFIILHCLFEENSKLNFVLESLDIVIKTLEEMGM